MTITIHRGTNQIGGCVTEYEHDGARLFVDFGEQLPGAPISDSPLKIEGLTCGDRSRSALLITHYHGDHIGKIAELAHSIPLFMGKMGREIFCTYQQRLTYIKGPAGDAARTMFERAKKIHTFRSNEEFKSGPFTIKPIPVDHSAFDAYGFLIYLTENPDVSVFHTGDFRTHGDSANEFDAAISSITRVNAIVCEATNIERVTQNAETEREIEEEFEKHFKENKYNSVFVSSTNIVHIRAIIRAAAKAHKMVLMDGYQHDILQAADFNADKIFELHFDKTSKETPRFYVPNQLRRLINWKGCVLIARTTPQFQSLIESSPARNGKKYLSMWKGYLIPTLPAYNPALAEAVGRDFEYVHTSGHADVLTLERLFEKIKADVIIPMHTENPEKFMATFGERWPVRLLSDGERFEV